MMADSWTTCPNCGTRYNRKIGHNCKKKVRQR